MIEKIRSVLAGIVVEPTADELNGQLSEERAAEPDGSAIGPGSLIGPRLASRRPRDRDTEDDSASPTSNTHTRHNAHRRRVTPAPTNRRYADGGRSIAGASLPARRRHDATIPPARASRTAARAARKRVAGTYSGNDGAHEKRLIGVVLSIAKLRVGQEAYPKCH